MPSLALSDGYTRETLIPAGETYPETWIAYRPMLAAERRRLALQTVRLDRHGEAGRRAAANLVSAALAARLVSWELFDGQGELLEIRPETIGELDPELFRRIYETVTRFEDEESSAKN